LFNFNFKKRIDTLDWLKHYGLNIIDCAIPGYRLETEMDFMLYKDILKKVLKKQKNCLILISLGGNDFINNFLLQSVEGSGNNIKLNEEISEKYIKEYLVNYKKYIINIRDYFINNNGDEIKFIIHGYDYVNASEKFFHFFGDGILTNLFKRINVVNNDTLINKIVCQFIDIYNKNIATIEKDIDNVYYIDIRGTLKKDEWIEDIHPTPEGYSKVAKKIFEYIMKNIPEIFYK
jgi:lysophospholipase L1-like esterase